MKNFRIIPAFNDLLQPLTKDNFEGRVKNALKKISNTSLPNRDGEAILSGLGLWSGQNIDAQNSKYADSIKKKLKERGQGSVLNKIEIIYRALHTAKFMVLSRF